MSTVTAYNPLTPGNVFHFWTVTFSDLEADNTDWIVTGFAAVPQLSSIYTVDGTPRVYDGEVSVHLNETTVTAVVPKIIYTNDLGQEVTVERVEVEVGPGGAWRATKIVADVGTGGSFRVMLGAIPGDLFTKG